MDQNLLFVIFSVVLLIFIVRKNLNLVITILVIAITYCLYIQKFNNPREFISYIKGKAIETFAPCSSTNQGYCPDDDSDYTFLPDILRAGKANDLTFENRPFNLKLDKLTQINIGNNRITLGTIMTDIPELQDFKLYLDKVLNFTSRVITDDHIQLTFLNNKLNNKMLKIFYAAYIVNTNNILPAQNYNELLMAQHAFLQTLNMFVFVSMNDEFTYTLNELKTEFNQLCKSLNTNIINKINEIDPDDYHIATGRLPTIDEPVGVNAYDYDINV